MARITTKAWRNYISILRRVSDRASNEMRAMLTKLSAQYEAGAVDGIRKIVEDAGFEFAALEKYTSVESFMLQLQMQMP